MRRVAVHNPTLASRWNGHCAYCDEPIDASLPYRHPRAPTCDHFIPRKRGGRRSPLNTVYACKTCNEEKGSVDPRRLIWVWLRLDPEGLINTILVNMEPVSLAEYLAQRTKV